MCLCFDEQTDGRGRHVEGAAQALVETAGAGGGAGGESCRHWHCCFTVRLTVPLLLFLLSQDLTLFARVVEGFRKRFWRVRHEDGDGGDGGGMMILTQAKLEAEATEKKEELEREQQEEKELLASRCAPLPYRIMEVSYISCQIIPHQTRPSLPTWQYCSANHQRYC